LEGPSLEPRGGICGFERSLGTFIELPRSFLGFSATEGFLSAYFMLIYVGYRCCSEDDL
jgi:hypothetical protein